MIRDSKVSITTVWLAIAAIACFMPFIVMADSNDRVMAQKHANKDCSKFNDRSRDVNRHCRDEEAETDSSTAVVDEAMVDEPAVIVNPGLVQFQVATIQATETNAGSVRIMVERIDGSDGPLSVNYSTSELADGGALEGMDFMAAQGSLPFADGQTSAVIYVTIPDDGVSGEGTESFGISLSGDCCLGAISSTRVLIEDTTVAADTSTDTSGTIDGGLSLGGFGF